MGDDLLRPGAGVEYAGQVPQGRDPSEGIDPGPGERGVIGAHGGRDRFELLQVVGRAAVVVDDEIRVERGDGFEIGRAGLSDVGDGDSLTFLLSQTGIPRES
jgi:hypothetical protein